jgi:hypothetical protein
MRLILSCLTPASRFFIENLTLAQLGKKFTAFYETQRYITLLGKARLSLLAILSRVYASQRPISLRSPLIILSTHRHIVIVLHGCETWSLTLREERRLRVENRVLRRIFLPRNDEVTGGVEEHA